jgi:hypothetical protein
VVVVVVQLVLVLVALLLMAVGALVVVVVPLEHLKHLVIRQQQRLVQLLEFQQELACQLAQNLLVVLLLAIQDMQLAELVAILASVATEEPD